MKFEDKKEISSILDYLERTHGLAVLKKHIADPALQKDKLFTSNVLEPLGIEHVGRWENANVVNVYRKNSDGVAITGFDYLLDLQLYSRVEPNSVIVWFPTPQGKIEIIQKEPREKVAVRFKDTEVLINLKDALSQPEDKDIYLKGENSVLRVQILVERFYGKRNGDAVEMESLNGKMLLKFKR